MFKPIGRTSLLVLKFEVPETKSHPNLFSFLKNYKGLIFTVIVLSLSVNLLGLLLPKLNSRAIDSLQTQTYDRNDFLLVFIAVCTLILTLNLLLTTFSNITAEKIAAELRRQVIAKISRQSFKYINEVSTSKLLTNLTADVDAVKAFINLGMVLAFAAVIQLVGSAIILLTINWNLAIPVILTIPLLLIAFMVIFKSIEEYFGKAQQVIDKLNRVINESIVGSALIRVLNARKFETAKFTVVNEESKFIGTKIVTAFAALFPIISVVINLAYLLVLGYGGIQVIDQTLSAGDFTAFFSYIFIFITPVIMLGFLASSVGRAVTTYGRIMEVISAEEPEDSGTVKKELTGNIELKNVTLDFGNIRVLKDINFTIKPGTKVGIIGPTAAGKTQIFYLISGLINPTEGKILIDGNEISEFERNNLYAQMGMVFQDSIIFNTTLRENIAFRNEISEADIWKAVETAELRDFAEALPNKLDTRIAERGTSLSGGQKQRLTLARALALNPQILLLDDFTARVDINTERKIFANIEKNYPDTTVIAITQKINSVKDFDQIILIMEGELLANGKHAELLESSLEYKQIFNSQQRTEEN